MGKKLRSNSAMVADARLNIYEASRMATERSMSNKRLLATVSALLLGLFLSYTSFFYFPAYTEKSTIIGIKTEQGEIPKVEKVKRFGLDPYLQHILFQRGYLKAGQTVSLSYKLAEGTKLKLVVSKCTGPIIIEVYSCRGTKVDTIEIGSRLEGIVDMTVLTNGFYHFDEQILELPIENPEFKVIWKRL